MVLHRCQTNCRCFDLNIHYRIGLWLWQPALSLAGFGRWPAQETSWDWKMLMEKYVQIVQISEQHMRPTSGDWFAVPRHVRSPSHCTCFSGSSSQKVCARKTPMKTSLGKSSKFKRFDRKRRKCFNKLSFQIRTLPQWHLFSRSTTQYELIELIDTSWYMIMCSVSLCTVYTCTRLKKFIHIFHHVQLYQWHFSICQLAFSWDFQRN